MSKREQAVSGVDDPRLLFNVTAPASTFICGSQGSGKIHTLSCKLETCLLPSYLGRLANPLTGVVFHYNTFISDTGGSLCETAYLSSLPPVSMSLMLTNLKPLKIDQRHLNTKRIMDLMTVSQYDVPLYMESLKRILREMRIVQQQTGGSFDYQDFKCWVINSGLTPAQLGPLTQRLDTLESFIPTPQTNSYRIKGKSAQ
ncbi:hypothetical protein BDV12DRAFT_185679 [Aspergillus spectabilis]